MDTTKNCYLFSIVVKNKTTNKGAPVAFFITNAEFTNIIQEWLTWVKNLHELKVKSIMIDCSAAEIAAIKEAFGSQVSILLCHWHIQRAWEKNMKTMVRKITPLLF